MSRTSRIPHPPGARYVAIHVWAVERFGLAGAAIIGLLDFFDRAQSASGQPLASSARIIADLEGIVGRDSVLQALKSLQKAEVVERIVTTISGARNLENHVRYSLNAAGVARLFETPEIRSFRNSGFQESPEVLKSVLKSGLKSEVPSYIELELEVEAAAPHAHARAPASAAAIPSVIEKRRHPHRSMSGIECWYLTEDAEAIAIEDSASADQIARAVAAIKARKNSAGKSQSPVPALVHEELEKQQRELHAAERRAITEAQLQQNVQIDLDPAAMSKGAKFLSDGFLRRLESNSNHP